MARNGRLPIRATPLRPTRPTGWPLRKKERLSVLRTLEADPGDPRRHLGVEAVELLDRLELVGA